MRRSLLAVLALILLLPALAIAQTPPVSYTPPASGGGGGSGANTTLSNLTAPTAVNKPIYFGEFDIDNQSVIFDDRVRDMPDGSGEFITYFGTFNATSAGDAAYGADFQPTYDVKGFAADELDGVAVNTGAADSVGGGSLTGQYGVHIYPNADPVATTKYGIYVGNQTAAGTNWNVYVAGTTPNHFGGAVTAGQLATIRQSVSASGHAGTCDFASGATCALTLQGGGADTLTLSNPVTGGRYLFELIQPSGSDGTITWPGTVHFPGGTAPTLTTTDAHVDIVSCYYNGTSYFCDSAFDFAP